jgi:gliding motility-associated-like protein
MAISAGGSFGQLQVSTALTPVQLVEDVLVGSCVSISNIRFNGTLNPATVQPGTGSFTNGQATNMGLTNGILLSTGPANQVANPASFFQSTGLIPNYTSDPDLVAISGGTINNVAALEFDFVPTGDSISFRYVFGSEEFPDWVCSEYNDAFGFFLSGPGITGPFSNNAVNLALIPGGNTPVAINTVNSGTAGINGQASTCAAANPNWQANSQYFVNNATGTTIVYNGFTVVLTARAAVQCNQTYHIKLAICDVVDEQFDSGVFLEAGSFSSVPFVPELTPGPSIVGNTILESCLPLTMDIQRTSCDLNTTESVTMSFGGTAEMGVDITPAFPTELVFDPGVSSIPISFFATVDSDGPETFSIDLQTIDCNGQPAVSSFEFVIDEVPPLVLAGSTTSIACEEELVLAPTVSGGLGQYEYTWSTGETTPSITVAPLAATAYTLTVTDLCDVSIAATYQVDISPAPPLNMNIQGSSDLVEGCQVGRINIIRPQGTSGAITVVLTGSGNATPDEDYVLLGEVVIADDLFNVIIDLPTLPDELIEGNETAIITGSYTNACAQTVTASVTFTIIDVEPLLVTANDIQAECGPDSLLILATVTGGFGPFQFTWNTGEETAGILVPLLEDGQYVVEVTDACGREATTQALVSIDCDIIIPNVFTPNNDGLNDRWEIDGLANRTNTVRVFNRWGQLVLDAKNYRNTWAAADVPDGTYYYEVIVDGKGDPFTGHVTILRNRW